MAITRKDFLTGAAAVLATSVAPMRAALPKRRPNVLLVLADEWRGQAFCYHGDRNAPTSTFDRFARESMDFPQAVSPAPICCPARASLITGQTPLTHGVYINDVELKPNGQTLGEAFAAAGYKTGYIGKWHLHGSPDGRYGRRRLPIPRASRFGFDYWKVAECDHNYMKSHYYDGDDTTIKYWEGFDSIAQTADAESFIREHAKQDEPYFLTLSWGPPHFPYMAPSPYKEKWADRPIELPPNVPEADREKAIAELRGYYAQIDVLNDCFARVLKAVDDSGAGNDTIVVFMSDHGEMGYSHGLQYKNVPWEESIRVPFMLRYPRQFGKRGRKMPGLLSIPDVMPTLLGLAGIPIPNCVEGYDWSRSMQGAAPDAPRSVFLNMMVSSVTMRPDGISEYRGVRTARYTYVRSIKGPWLLYDNWKDKFQQNNLIGDPAYKKVIAALQGDLENWMRIRKDAFLPGLAYLRRDNLMNYLETAIPVERKASPESQWHLTLSPNDPDAVPTEPRAKELLGWKK